MRVAVYDNNADIRVEERPVPAIGPAEILVHIRASGICGSDVTEWYRVPKAFPASDGLPRTASRRVPTGCGLGVHVGETAEEQCRGTAAEWEAAA